MLQNLQIALHLGTIAEYSCLKLVAANREVRANGEEVRTTVMREIET